MNAEIISTEVNLLNKWSTDGQISGIDFFTDDILLIDPFLDKPVVGKEDLRQHFSICKDFRVGTQIKMIDPAIVGSGLAVVLSYICEITGSSLPEKWNVTQVYFRKGSRWQIVHSHWSYLLHRCPIEVEIPLMVLTESHPYPGVKGELMVLESRAMERWRKGDPWGFIEISAPGITYFDTGTPGRINGRDALAAEYKLREGKIFYDVMDFITPEVRVRGDLGVLGYRFLSTWLNPDGSVARRIPWYCSEVFHKLDGLWKLIHTHWSFIKGERIQA